MTFYQILYIFPIEVIYFYRKISKIQNRKQKEYRGTHRPTTEDGHYSYFGGLSAKFTSSFCFILFYKGVIILYLTLYFASCFFTFLSLSFQYFCFNYERIICTMQENIQLEHRFAKRIFKKSSIILPSVIILC